MPERIQRKRTKGFRLQEASPNGLPVVYVGRPSKFGNPYIVDRPEQRQQAVDNFRELLALYERRGYPNDFSALRGKNLACWCPLPAAGEPDLCHAAVLLELANA